MPEDEKGPGAGEDEAPRLEVVETIAAARRACRRARLVAFGPDCFGLVAVRQRLHEGHLSLIRRARTECGAVVVYLAQAGSAEEQEDDARLLAEAGVTVLFRPRVALIEDEIGTQVSREGMFAVPPEKLTLWVKLLHICGADKMYFGDADGVACAGLGLVVRDLSIAGEIVARPTLRDRDGLAFGWELEAGERRSAMVVPRAMEAMRQTIADGIRTREAVLRAGVKVLERQPGARIEYLEALQPETLLPAEEVGTGALVALAVRLRKTRVEDSCFVD